jgi:hypothetical protein
MFLSDADLALFSTVGEILIILGLVGVVSLFVSRRDRHIQGLSLGLLFTLMAASGGALIWRTDELGMADRDLLPDQQATLSHAISQFPAAKFEVFTNRSDREAHALALKIADAVKVGSGVMPDFTDDALSPPLGVVFVFADKNTHLRAEFTDKVGRLLMAARIVVNANKASELSENTVRIMVGQKP